MTVQTIDSVQEIVKATTFSMPCLFCALVLFFGSSLQLMVTRCPSEQAAVREVKRSLLDPPKTDSNWKSDRTTLKVTL